MPPSLALEFAGGKPFMRKVLVHQVRHADCVAFLDNADGRRAPVALAMFDRRRRRRAELALAFAPRAGARVRSLARVAHLTCARLAEDGVLVFTRIAPGNHNAARLALLAGFVPGGFRDPAIWLWKDR